MSFRAVVLGFLGCHASSLPVLKCGGPTTSSGITGSGKMAWDMIQDWVNATSTKFRMELNWQSNDDTSAAVSALTDPSVCGANCVDVLIPPYGSGASKTAIEAVHQDWSGVVMIWGGASDALFSDVCSNKSFKCFGTFTVASQYVVSGLEGLDAAHTDPLKVALVDNGADAFSKSVCAGAVAQIEASDGLTMVSRTTLAGSTSTEISSEDVTLVGTTYADTDVDVWVLCGKDGFVVPVAEWAVGRNPKAILGTNTISSNGLAKYTEAGNSACVMEPTQWAGGTSVDSIVGVTSDGFSSALGSHATYHAASAAGAGIALVHAMESTAGTLASRLANVDAPSFYGQLKFNADGTIMKPMYTQQRLDGENVVVLPRDSAVADLKADLVACKGGASAPTAPTAATSPTAPTASADSAVADSAVAGASSVWVAVSTWMAAVSLFV